MIIGFFDMRKEKGFGFIELLVAMLIGGLLVGAALAVFSGWGKGKSTVAVINLDGIRKAEELQKIETGSYITAKDTEQVNKSLDLSIKDKDYQYKVTEVTEDGFVAVAEKIEKDKLPSAPKVIAMDASGKIDYQYPGGSPTTTTGTVSGTGGGAVSSGGTGSSTSGGSGGGTSTGVDTGTGTGTGGNGNTGGSTTVSSTAGGGSGADAGEVLITRALEILSDSGYGISSFNLINEKDIDISFKDLGAGTLGQWIPTYWLDFYPEDNVTVNSIYLDPSLKTDWTAEEIATVIVHEATHADYNYNTEDWVNLTIERYGVSRDDLSWVLNPVTNELVLNDTIDQEYNCFVQETLFWIDIRGDQTNEELDGLVDLYEQGEAYLYVEVASRYSGYNFYAKELK